MHAEEILAAYPDLPRKQRETAILQEVPAALHLRDRLAARRRLSARAAGRRLRRLVDRDLLSRRTPDARAERRHPRLEPGHTSPARAHVDGDPRHEGAFERQLELSGQLDFLELPYHRAIMADEIPLSIGGGIGQSRTMMLLLRKAHLGEVSVTVWPQVLKELCEERNIHVLQ